MAEVRECKDCGKAARYFWPDGRQYCGPCHRASLKFMAEVLKADRRRAVR